VISEDLSGLAPELARGGEKISAKISKKTSGAARFHLIPARRSCTTGIIRQYRIGADDMSNILRPAFVKSIQRLQCTKCGAEANASCNCGANYKPVQERVREYDEANPGKSTRAAAADLGVSQSAVQKARKSGEHQCSPDIVSGRDGKTYPASRDKDLATNVRNVFLMNCAAISRMAHYQGDAVDKEIRAAARRVADAWTKLADDLEAYQ
jgi:hypothetical protein